MRVDNILLPQKKNRDTELNQNKQIGTLIILSFSIHFCMKKIYLLIKRTALSHYLFSIDLSQINTDFS